MGRKETIWGARHIIEQQEIDRIVDEYEKIGLLITKLEASAIIAERSKNFFWKEKDAKKILMKLRGFNI